MGVGALSPPAFQTGRAAIFAASQGDFFGVEAWKIITFSSQPKIRPFSPSSNRCLTFAGDNDERKAKLLYEEVIVSG
jgi:hypothetical protein